jgi:hypothetical protein
MDVHLSQIDEQILNELPADIRQELISHKTKSNMNMNMIKKSSDLNNKTNHNHNNNNQNESQTQSPSNLFIKEDFDQIKQVLVSWLTNESNKSKIKIDNGIDIEHEVSDDHRFILELYIDDCLTMNRLTNVHKLLKYLKYLFIDNDGGNVENGNTYIWKQFASQVIESTQHKIIKKFKHPLQL